MKAAFASLKFHFVEAAPQNAVISPNFLVWKSSFHIVLCESREIMRNCAFPQNFHTRKLGEITLFYAVKRWNRENFVA